jgi:hypothetical protein
MERYAQEFTAAWDMTERLGLKVAPLQLLVQKDCIDMDQIAPVIQKFLRPYKEDDLFAQAIFINAQLADLISRKIGAPMYLTLGWTEVDGQPDYAHGEARLRQLLKDGRAALKDGVPMHVWLTSPACEILDVTLPTTLGLATGNRDLIGRILYRSNQDRGATNVVHHPAVIGIDFLDRIGATITLGAIAR